MQSTVSWHYTLSWARSLKRNDSPYAKKLLDALEVLVSGASWPQERISQAYTGEQNVCQLCGHSPCDSLHTLWTCPCIAGFDDPAITNSEHLIPLASNEGHQYPCLWFRGILPLPLAQPTSIEAPVPDTFIPHYYLVAPDAGSWPSGSYFGDAGGGRHNLYPSLRRVGIGVAHLNQLDHSFLFGVGSPLFGEHQTVHRGEAVAALLLIVHLANDASVDFYGDNASFVNSFNKGYDFFRRSLNAAIYTTHSNSCIKNALFFALGGCPANYWKTLSA